MSQSLVSRLQPRPFLLADGLAVLNGWRNDHQSSTVILFITVLLVTVASVRVLQQNKRLVSIPPFSASRR